MHQLFQKKLGEYTAKKTEFQRLATVTAGHREYEEALTSGVSDASESYGDGGPKAAAPGGRSPSSRSQITGVEKAKAQEAESKKILGR